MIIYRWMYFSVPHSLYQEQFLLFYAIFFPFPSFICQYNVIDMRDIYGWVEKLEKLFAINYFPMTSRNELIYSNCLQLEERMTEN